VFFLGIEIFFVPLYKDFIMPELYTYFGLIFEFYSNEHPPIHVHIKKEDREIKASFIMNEGKCTEIELKKVRGKDILSQSELKLANELLFAMKDDIIKKWVDFFVLNKKIKSVKITKRVKL
jgi:hypothetical protein